MNKIIRRPTTALDAEDQIDRAIDDLWTIWLALGNSADLPDDGLIRPIRESLNEVRNRLSEARDMMTESRT